MPYVMAKHSKLKLFMYGGDKIKLLNHVYIQKLLGQVIYRFEDNI